MELDFGSISFLLISDAETLKEKIHRIFYDQIVFNLSPKSRFFKRLEQIAKIYKHINFIIVDFSDEKPSGNHPERISEICDHFSESQVIGIFPADMYDNLRSRFNHRSFHPIEKDIIEKELRDTVALITRT